MAPEKYDSIEQAAAARRERLKALRAAQELLTDPEDESAQADDDEDTEKKEGKRAPPLLPKFEDPVEAAPPPSVKKEDPFVSIAPKKPNWDLWRDLQKKLEKCTQKAIYKLMEQQQQKIKRLVAEDENGDVVED